MEYLGFDDNKSNSLHITRNRTIFARRLCTLLHPRSPLPLQTIIHPHGQCTSSPTQLLFLLGLYFFIGISGILKFFTKKGKVQGSCVYFGGLLVVILGWTFVGVVCQIVGFFIIFRSFLPDFYDYICRLPVVGHYLSKEGVI